MKAALAPPPPHTHEGGRSRAHFRTRPKQAPVGLTHPSLSSSRAQRREGLARTSPATASQHLKAPQFSTKGATRACCADFRLRMRLPSWAGLRGSVCVLAPGPGSRGCAL